MLPQHTRWLKSLADKHAQHRLRTLRVHEGLQGPILSIDGQSVLSFCSNDYLGLASHPALIQAVQTGVARFGSGSGSAHLLAGHSLAHQAFEEAFAAFVGAERALVFSTGYLANLAMRQFMLACGVIFQDKLNHASLIDAALQGEARFKRYQHLDCAHLQRLMLNTPAEERLVMTDSVFSMDGDQADLQALSRVCAQHQAMLYVDDAHGFGVLGEQGRGSYAQAGLVPSAERVMMATLGKSMGLGGAVIAGDAWVIEALIQSARSYIFTTASPPAMSWAGLTSLTLLSGEVGDHRRQTLQKNIVDFRRMAQQGGLEVLDSQTAIQPVMMHSAQRALAVSQALWAQGIWAPAIRMPTVKAGQERLRISLSALHTPEQISRLVESLCQILEDQP
jgi:8-amino-7-oxononanoate synthase